MLATPFGVMGVRAMEACGVAPIGGAASAGAAAGARIKATFDATFIPCRPAIRAGLTADESFARSINDFASGIRRKLD
jgi:hypothetical protein